MLIGAGLFSTHSEIVKVEQVEVPVPPWMNELRGEVFLIEAVNDTGDERMRGKSMGSGWHIGNGRVLTAYHVVDGDSDAIVTMYLWHPDLRQRLRFRGKLVAYDPSLDLALLQIERHALLGPGLQLGTSKDIMYNRVIHALGCPGGTFPPTIASGIVRGEGRSWISFDAGVWYGYSGGVVVDADSKRVIGLIVQIGFRREKTDGIWEIGPQTDLGVAVHVDRIAEWLDEISPETPEG